MSAKVFDPSRLDVAAFAAAEADLSGRWPLAAFRRLGESAAPERPPAAADEVEWRVLGERLSLRNGEHQSWLRLDAKACLAMQCQRCLAPVEVPLSVDRKFLFVHGEDAAAQIDAGSDDDVLAMTRALDLQELVEDELLLAMPLVALHDICPLPLVVEADEPAAERPNPFAALAVLRGDGPVN